MSAWTDEEVRNEVRSRDRNEWIEEVRDGLADDATAIQMFVCECGDPSCQMRIGLTRDEYEGIRGYPTRFAIALDHENPEIDQLLAEGRRFTVIQKGAGRAAKIARETSERHRSA